MELKTRKTPKGFKNKSVRIPVELDNRLKAVLAELNVQGKDFLLRAIETAVVSHNAVIEAEYQRSFHCLPPLGSYSIRYKVLVGPETGDELKGTNNESVVGEIDIESLANTPPEAFDGGKGI